MHVKFSIPGLFKFCKHGNLPKLYNYMKRMENTVEQEGHYDPLSLDWLICKIPSYQTLQYLGIGLKHNTHKKD